MRRFAMLAAGLLAGTAAPALAQDHSGHGAHNSAPAPTQTECEAEAERHRAMGHPVPEGECAPVDHAEMDHDAMDHGDAEHPDGMDQDAMPMDHGQIDHQQMDHDQMDHGQNDHGEMDHDSMGEQPMDHAGMDHGAMPMDIPVLPPPASSGSGPPRAADAIWGADAMRQSREALRREQGGQTFAGLMLDRFEYRIREDEDGFLWDGDAWYGGDINRVWIESEGEGMFEEGVEDADISVLYGRAISPWFDLQAGVRQDLTGPTRTYLDLGIQGLAPYLFEVEADVYLSNKGDVTASAEVELDQRVTQRLILQPRAEIALAAQDVPELGIGAGIDTIEAGLRLRYEIAREFAPYIGIEQEWKVGQSADFARAAGEDPSVTNYVLGVRFWF